MNQAPQSSCPQEDAHGGAWPPTNRASSHRWAETRPEQETPSHVGKSLPMAGADGWGAGEFGGGCEEGSGPSTGATLMDPGGRHGPSRSRSVLQQRGVGGGVVVVVESAFYLPPTQHWA